jgi:hypothetical protein
MSVILMERKSLDRKINFSRALSNVGFNYVIMASHFDDTFFKILNLNFCRFAQRIEVLRAGNLKLASES